MSEIVESEISDTCPGTSCIKGRFYIIDRLTSARKTLFVGSARGRPRNRFIRSGWIGIALPVFVFVRSGEGRIKAVFRSTSPPCQEYHFGLAHAGYVGRHHNGAYMWSASIASDIYTNHKNLNWACFVPIHYFYQKKYLYEAGTSSSFGTK